MLFYNVFYFLTNTFILSISKEVDLSTFEPVKMIETGSRFKVREIILGGILVTTQRVTVPGKPKIEVLFLSITRS